MRTDAPLIASTETTAEFAIAEAPYGETGVVLEVRGELDIATAPQLRARLADVIGKRPALVLVDLSKVDFLDSVTLAVLLRAHKSLGDTSRMTIVVAPESYARLIFDVTGVDQHLHVVATREQAMEGRPA